EPADAAKISPKKPPTQEPRDVFCFFDNKDVKLRAPFDAQSLMEKLARLAKSGTPPRKLPKKKSTGRRANGSPAGAANRQAPAKR
ncbi:hypothetical protein M2C68_21315, partial [Pseudomonas sp. BAgro211]|nr:hypothetical protein [Pseudomonas sp. BAgro211]